MTAPTLDGKVNAVSSGAATTTGVLTTTQTDDIIIAIVDIHSNQSTVTVSGVTCDGVAMTQRQYTQTPSSLNLPLIHSVWYLHVSAALSAKNIVASYTNYGGSTYQDLTAFGVHGCNLTTPFDPNSSLPAHTQVNNSSRTTHNVTFSTSAVDTFVFASLSMDNNNIFGSPDTSPATCTKIEANNMTVYQGSYSEYCTFATAQSSQSWNVYAAYTNNNGDIATIDALQAPSAETDLPATNHSLGVRAAVALERERQLSAAPGLGVRMAVTLEDERQLSAAPSLGVRMAAALERERQLSAAPGLGVRMAASLSDSRDLTAVPGLGARMAVTLDRELQLTVAPHLGLTVAAALGNSQSLIIGPTLGVLMSVALSFERHPILAPALGVRMAATLTRELHIATSMALGVRMAAALPNYLGLSAALHIGMRMAAALTLYDDIGGVTPAAHTVHPSLGVYMAVILTRAEIHISTTMTLGARMAASMYDVSSLVHRPVVVVMT